jgi:hypothetical protein
MALPKGVTRETHWAKVVVGAVPAGVAVDPVDNSQQRAALGSGLDPERHDAVRERSAFLPHSVPHLHAGNGRNRLWLGEVRLRQPSLAKGRNGDRPPYLFRRRVEFVFERDFGFTFGLLARLARNVAH